MSVVERKEREKAEMRKKILEAAEKIIKEDGVNGISVRKIAKIIEYSPAIIYHYFENKEEIVEKLIAESYLKILSSLSAEKYENETAESKLKSNIRNFLTLAIGMGDTYKSMMLNTSPTVLSHTAVLHNGASLERPTIAMLCENLRETPAYSETDDKKLELIAQIIWSALFGLATRMIVENVNEEQQKRLIDEMANFVLCAIENGNG